ncbi:MAG: hypothetical protein NC048_05425 [Bacteroides sp.]|nr:hypothetical protein [Ruminococcus flavefaciens]MCM1554918.1 hypothetical protein [Bacteroides sp.]
MKTIKLFSNILLISTILVSCSKPDRYYLTETDKQMVPYKLGDTIRYMDEKGNPLALICKGSTIRWESWEGNMMTQILRTEVLSESGNSGFTILVSGNWGGISSRYHMVIQDNASEFQKDLPYDAAGNFIENTYDSVLISSQVYYDVTGTPELYYNKTHGVLQMKKDGKAVFTLQEYIPAR